MAWRSRKKQPKKRKVQEKGGKRTVKRAGSHARALAGQRAALQELFFEREWNSPEEKSLALMLADSNPDHRISAMLHPKARSSREILRLMKKDPDKRVVKKAKELFNQLGERT